MNVINVAAKELQMSPDMLITEGVKTYLRQRLSKVESDIFILAKKYGVQDVFEMDSKVKNGFISEKNSYEDYFALDNLEADRDKLKKFLREI
ncbi:hypothetical protein BuS5_01597 [Desulfosarcina sp. BuS5]|uniref:hypothetical protein n=1 Tax=Desulfosarcina sp. BuS5 TaxID=933262 RepID=UPI000481C64F|nr:hypothetical protein [Desulfosarcina sp. BuS5]WDN88629.1 hypothetical protein BuS5_01597 [Desulfosarcina sp. BuS5]